MDLNNVEFKIVKKKKKLSLQMLDGEEHAFSTQCILVRNAECVFKTTLLGTFYSKVNPDFCLGLVWEVPSEPQKTVVASGVVLTVASYQVFMCLIGAVSL